MEALDIFCQQSVALIIGLPDQHHPAADSKLGLMGHKPILEIPRLLDYLHTPFKIAH